MAIHSVEGPVNAREGTMPDWRTELEVYLKDGSALADLKVAFPLLRRTRHFMMLNGPHFIRSSRRPLLWCVGPKEAEGIFKEIHKGCCGSHLEGWALAMRVILATTFGPP